MHGPRLHPSQLHHTARTTLIPAGNRSRPLPRLQTVPSIRPPSSFAGSTIFGMAVIREQDLDKGRDAFAQWRQAARQILAEYLPGDDEDAARAFRLDFSPRLPRRLWAMAVRYSLYLLEKKAPGEGVEVRVAPWGAIKILDGPASDPHNLTPPDVIELEPDVWMRLATGITSWDEEKDAGRITAVGERDDLSRLLPLA